MFIKIFFTSFINFIIYRIIDFVDFGIYKRYKYSKKLYNTFSKFFFKYVSNTVVRGKNIKNIENHKTHV